MIPRIDGFKYSDQQRAALLECLSIDGEPRRRELLIGELERAGSKYISVTQARTGDLETARQWEKISYHANELISLLQAFGGELDFRFLYLPTALKSIEIHASVEANVVRKNGVFAAAKKAAKAKNPQFSPKQDAAVAKWNYYREVLIVWLQAGGTLGISTNADKIYGPLVRYFKHAAAPVLNGAMPAGSSLPALIRSYKRDLSPELAGRIRAAFEEDYQNEQEGNANPFPLGSGDW